MTLTRAQIRGRRVLLTGHTGFKGGWLALWLLRLGAQVTGVSLPPEHDRGIHEAAGLGRLLDGRFADIRDRDALDQALRGVDAELVIHMAAQPLVRASYAQPVETFATNVMGTAHVLEAARRMPSLAAVVVVTSDKCYENGEWVWGYRESDPMGGADPYSASKGCAELLVSAWRRSFFSEPGGPRLATVRAGNVFGGGDWAADRLVPDIVRAGLDGQTVHIRNPACIRPWQHVLEPLAGYLDLAARLGSTDGAAFAEGWNFGPPSAEARDVGTFAREVAGAMGAAAPGLSEGAVPNAPHEAGQLRLDSAKAASRLGWRPRLSHREAVAMTTDWYLAQARGADMRAFSEAQIDRYEGMAA